MDLLPRQKRSQPKRNLRKRDKINNNSQNCLRGEVSSFAPKPLSFCTTGWRLYHIRLIDIAVVNCRRRRQLFESA